MRKVIILTLIQIACLLPMQRAFGGSLTIDTPSDGQNVTWRTEVKGSVAGARNVWVIVHAMERSDYWVQPKATINKKGQWQAGIYIGNETDTANIRDFEIKAISSPTEKIAEGQVLDIWPVGKLNSNVIKVFRNKP
ncbi:MAG: hypothetical protein JZU70_00145 [Chlorobium sp.]|jgi:hypothetical protein|nr:hypothetical protein [Chlorobium sp.]